MCPERIPIARVALSVEGQRRIVADARRGEMPLADARRALPPWIEGSTAGVDVTVESAAPGSTPRKER